MAVVDLVMPKLGESIMEATVLKWHKQPGDTVKMDETILEIATDKVDSEVPSTAEGVIEEILFQVNDVVPIGTAIARIHGDSLRVLSPPDLDDRVGWLLEPNERERGYLQQNRVPVRRWFGQRELRLAETVLEPGDRVAIVGQVRFVDPGEEGRVFYEITALPEGFVLISDERKALV